MFSLCSRSSSLWESISYEIRFTLFICECNALLEILYILLLLKYFNGAVGLWGGAGVNCFTYSWLVSSPASVFINSDYVLHIKCCQKSAFKMYISNWNEVRWTWVNTLSFTAVRSPEVGELRRYSGIQHRRARRRLCAAEFIWSKKI